MSNSKQSNLVRLETIISKQQNWKHLHMQIIYWSFYRSECGCFSDWRPLIYTIFTQFCHTHNDTTNHTSHFLGFNVFFFFSNTWLFPMRRSLIVQRHCHSQCLAFFTEETETVLWVLAHISLKSSVFSILFSGSVSSFLLCYIHSNYHST